MEGAMLLLIKSLGWSLVHSLWIGAVLYLLLILMFRFFVHTANARSLLALIALSAISVCFFASWIYGAFCKLQPQLLGNIEDLTVIKADRAIYQLSPAEWIESYLPWVTVLYLLGVTLLSIRLLKGFRKLHFICTNGLWEVPTTWKDVLSKHKNQLGLCNTIHFYLSDLVDVPAVIGHLKPIILFPVALSIRLSVQQVEVLLLHELVHVKRWDYLGNLVKVFVETTLFFNPFVRLIGNVLEEEREKACDDVVVDLTGQPIEYVNALLQLERAKQQAGQNLAMYALPKKKQLLERVKRIITKGEGNYGVSCPSLTFLGLLLLV